MDSRNFFNDFYSTHRERVLPRSLFEFFENLVRPRLNNPENVLDIGCGNYSLFEDVKQFPAKITAIDFSHEAIEQAPNSNIVYQEKSLTDKDFFSQGEFDLIFDSHCMNCLVEEMDRNVAFENIFRALKTEGLFASEFMVQPIDKKMATPFKMIKTARELEEEILSHKFNINYFMILKDSSFVNEVNGEKIFCDVLRVIAKKDFV